MFIIFGESYLFCAEAYAELDKLKLAIGSIICIHITKLPSFADLSCTFLFSIRAFLYNFVFEIKKNAHRWLLLLKNPLFLLFEYSNRIYFLVAWPNLYIHSWHLQPLKAYTLHQKTNEATSWFQNGTIRTIVQGTSASARASCSGKDDTTWGETFVGHWRPREP